MISKIIAWIKEFFRKKPKKQSELEQIVEDHEKKLKEIADEELDLDGINDYFNE